MKCKILFGALLLATAHTAAAASGSLADSLIPTYADATDGKRIATLMRLQIAAGRWQEAERSAQRLTELYRHTEPEHAFSIMPWRIYARGRRYEAAGAAWPD